MLITQKLQFVYGCSTYEMTALLSEMSIFYARAGCEIRLVSYGSKHASQSPSDKSFVYILTVVPLLNARVFIFLSRDAY